MKLQRPERCRRRGREGSPKGLVRLRQSGATHNKVTDGLLFVLLSSASDDDLARLHRDPEVVQHENRKLINLPST